MITLFCFFRATGFGRALRVWKPYETQGTPHGVTPGLGVVALSAPGDRARHVAAARHRALWGFGTDSLGKRPFSEG